MEISRTARKFFFMAIGSSLIGKDTSTDIAVRCPICGDSRTKKTSTRLHLYCKDDYEGISCFNGDCSAQNKSVYGFLRDFYPELLGRYKQETFKTQMNALASGEDVFEQFKTSGTSGTSGTSKSAETPELVLDKPVQTQDLSMYMLELKKSKECSQYIENRGIRYNSDFGDWFYGVRDLKIDGVLYPITDSLVIPLYYNREMYGFYSRSIASKSFYTHMRDVNVGFKIWNWFNVNINDSVYVFEGIFDALSMKHKNVIAMISAHLPEQRIKELKDPIFVLDNDKTGILNSIKHAQNGYKVFIQPTSYKEKDMNELMLNHPNLNVKELIDSNTYSGISAEIRLKSKL